MHTQGCPGNHTERRKKKLQTALESITTRTPGCTIRSQRGNKCQSFTENNTKLQQTKARFHRHKIQACRRGRREQTASQNFEEDGRKLWTLTKQLSDDDNSRAKITLKENSKLLNGEQAAYKFAKNYANESKIPVSASKQRERERERKRREMRERTACRTTVKPVQQALRLGELQRALKKLKQGKSPRPDGITKEMLIHLGSAAVCKLLQIFNHSWE